MEHQCFGPSHGEGGDEDLASSLRCTSDDLTELCLRVRRRVGPVAIR